MADATTVAVLIKARDEASSVLKRVGDQSQRMADGFKKHRREIGMAAAGMGAAITGAAVLSVKAASDLGESMNAVNVIFGDGAKVIHEFGQTSSRSAGLSTASFNQLAATTGALLKDVGLPMEQVAGLTTDLTVRAADMASVMNTSVEDALSAVGQALRGETEAIRRYAGDVTDASLEHFRLSEGMQKSVKDMSEQEKRLLRLDLIMKQTNTMAGDFANTQNSLANQMRIASAEFENTRAAIGMALLPIMEKLAGALMPILSSISDWIKQNPALSKWIIIITAAIGALLIPLGALLLILPGLAAGFAMVSASILPITIGLVAVVAAVAAAILIWKNWDKIMEVVKKGLVLVAKGFLEYVKTIMKGARAIADFIPGMDGLARKIDEGIGKIDDIERSMDKWAEGTKDAEVSITNSSENIADSQNAVAKASADKAVVVAESAVKVQAASKEEARVVEQSAQRQIDAAVELMQVDNDLKQKRIDNFLATRRAAAEAATAQRESINDLVASLDENSVKWRETGASVEEVMLNWQKITGQTLKEIGNEWDQAGIDVKDHESVLNGFVDRFGFKYFGFAEGIKRDNEKIASSISQAQQRINERMEENEALAQQQKMAAEMATVIVPKAPVAETRTGDLASLEGASVQAALGEFAGQTERTIRSQGIRANPVMNRAQLDRLTAQQIDKGWSSEKANSYREHLKAIGYATDKRAMGGFAGGLTLVGDRGPEIVNLPHGSYVHRSGTGPGGGVVNQFHFHGPVYGVESLKETVVEAVRDHALSGGFAGVFAEV